MSRLLPKVEEYSKKEYWDSRFENEDEYDWLCSFNEYSKILMAHLRSNDRVLVLGCGSSNLSANLYDRGYTRITNIDYSEVIIEKMRHKNSDTRPDMEWRVMDIFHMPFEAEHFDVVIDKATLDSFMVKEKDPWNLSDSIQQDMHTILHQISRCLKPEGGRFISITWAQPHFRKRLLAKTSYSWDIQVETFGSGLQYFVYTMTTGRHLSESDRQLGNITATSSTPTAVSRVDLSESEEQCISNLLAIELDT